MGFLSKLNPLNAPGMKPIKKLVGKSPVLNKLPGAGGPAKTRTPGVGTATKSPIAPSPGVVDKAASAGSAPAMSAPPPQRMPPPQMAPRPMPQMQPPPMEAPEAVPGMADMAQMQAPPMMAPQPEFQNQGNIQPQFDPRMMEQLKQRMGGNTGIAGGIMNRNAGRPSGIGPRFMG